MNPSLSLIPAVGMTDLRLSPLCFIDLETTGTEFGWHEIIDVGAIRTDPTGDNILGSWGRRIRPVHPERLSKYAADINGFSADGWADAEASSTALWQSFSEFSAGCVPVCHNPHFDRAFLELAAVSQWHVQLKLDYHWIGTESLAWPLVRQGLIAKPRMEVLCEFFGMESEPRPHRAQNGAEMCRSIYQRLLTLHLPAPAVPTGA